MTLAFRRHVLAAVALGSILSGITPALAGIQGEMDDMFNSLITSTPPGAYAGQSRDVLTGGSLTVKNKIMDTNLVNFVPPSFKSGCGGIDLFGGSFSFINAAQFTQLLRTIASNAGGYAFQLALNTMCPDCMAQIETLQKKIQALNQHLGNSCQLAKGLVTNPVGAFNSLEDSAEGVLNAATGVVSDAYAGMTAMGSTSPHAQAVASNPTAVNQQIRGNVIWRALVKQGVSGWFTYGDDTLNEEIMSLTGSYIVGADQTTSDGTDTQPQHTTLSPTGDITMTNLVEGIQETSTANTSGTNNYSIWQCDTTTQDGCLAPTLATEQLTSFKALVENTLLGADGASGAVLQLSTGAALTSAQSTMLAAMPGNLGGLVKDIAEHNDGTAREFVRLISPQVSLYLAERTLAAMIQAVTASLAGSTDINAPKVQAMIKDADRQIHAETLVLQAKYGSVIELVERAHSLQAILPKNKYGSFVAFK